MRWLGIVLGLAGLLCACGSDPPTAYSALTESNFLASCVDNTEAKPLDADADADDRSEFRRVEGLRTLRNDICECVYEGNRLPYARFAQYDGELKDDLERPLQTAISEDVADCVRQEGDL